MTHGTINATSSHRNRPPVNGLSAPQTVRIPFPAPYSQGHPVRPVSAALDAPTVRIRPVLPTPRRRTAPLIALTAALAVVAAAAALWLEYAALTLYVLGGHQ